MIAFPRRSAAVVLLLALSALACSAPALAFDAAEPFAKGSKIFTLQATGGAQLNAEGFAVTSGITFVGAGVRLSYLPFEPFGPSWLRAAFEPGVEGWTQVYLHPQTTAAGGGKGVLRLNGVSFGRLVPYLEFAGGVGATGLYVPESRSTFTFIIEGGPGLSYFVTDDVALTAGYRFQHFSNGGTVHPNRGYEGQSGVVGLSFFFK